MKEPKFRIVVSDYSSSVQEWKRALEAPPSKLPKLNEQQKEVARRFGITDEEYARGLLAGLYGEERMRDRSQRLGEVVEGILEGLGKDYRLAAVIAEMFKGRWVFRIESPEKVVNIDISRELADDVLDSGAIEEIEKLKNRMLIGLGRKELVVRG